MSKYIIKHEAVEFHNGVKVTGKTKKYWIYDLANDEYVMAFSSKKDAEKQIIEFNSDESKNEISSNDLNRYLTGIYKSLDIIHRRLNKLENKGK